jgi:hypothetical protein
MADVETEACHNNEPVVYQLAAKTTKTLKFYSRKHLHTLEPIKQSLIMK